MSKELAERIVRLGVGVKSKDNLSPRLYNTNIFDRWMTADDFVRDGRVILALMEKVHFVECAMVDPGWYAEAEPSWGDSAKDNTFATNDELSIAIAEACCEALEAHR